MKPSSIPRLKLIFVGLFAVACAIIWAMQVFYVWPRDRCEAHEGWWDPQGRVCATPIAISKLTGRPNSTKADSTKAGAGQAAPAPVAAPSAKAPRAK